MTPRIPLFLAAVLCALPALAVQPTPAEMQKAAKEAAKTPKGKISRAYRTALETVDNDGAIAVNQIQCDLRASDTGQHGGANQAAGSAGVCDNINGNAAGQCLVLLAQLEDMIATDGDKVSPHVYAVLDSVLRGAAKKYKSFSKLDEALQKNSRGPGDSYYCFNGAATVNPAARAPIAARDQAVGLIRRALKSSRVISGTALGDPAPLAAHAARWAGEFDDVHLFLAQDLKNNAASADPQVLDETVKTLGERVRDADTAARLMVLFLDHKQKRRVLSDPLKIRILSSLRMTVAQLHPLKHDKDRDSVWAPKDVEAGQRYFFFACGLLSDEGCVDKDGKDASAGKPVCAAARELLIFAPKPHKATCDKKSGEPLGPKCK